MLLNNYLNILTKLTFPYNIIKNPKDVNGNETDYTYNQSDSSYGIILAPYFVTGVNITPSTLGVLSLGILHLSSGTSIITKDSYNIEPLLTHNGNVATFTFTNSYYFRDNKNYVLADMYIEDNYKAKGYYDITSTSSEAFTIKKIAIGIKNLDSEILLFAQNLRTPITINPSETKRIEINFIINPLGNPPYEHDIVGNLTGIGLIGYYTYINSTFRSGLNYFVTKTPSTYTPDYAEIFNCYKPFGTNYLYEPPYEGITPFDFLPINIKPYRMSSGDISYILLSTTDEELRDITGINLYNDDVLSYTYTDVITEDNISTKREYIITNNFENTIVINYITICRNAGGIIYRKKLNERVLVESGKSIKITVKVKGNYYKVKE